MSFQQLLSIHSGGENSTEGGAPEHEVIPPPPFRWKTRIVLPASIFGVSAVLFLVAAWESVAPAVDVFAEPAIARQVSGAIAGGTSVVASGWIEAEPHLEYVSALTDGVVAEIRVLEGESVESGQVVATLVPDDARLALAEAEANVRLRDAELAMATAKLAAARTAWANPVERDSSVAVTSAQIIEIEAEIRQVRSEINAREILNAQALRDSGRFAKLRSSGSVPEREAEEVDTRLAAGLAELDVLRHRLATLEGQAQRRRAESLAARQNRELRIEETRELAEAEADVRRATAELELSRVARDMAALRLERTEVVSSFSGVAVTRYKSPGDKVGLGMDEPRSATILSVYRPGRIQARIDVPLVDIAKISSGQICEITSETAQGKRFLGRVSRILHEADIQKNTLQVKVTIDEPTTELRPEMLVRARFLAIEENRSGSDVVPVFVNASAVRDGQVWVVVGIRDGIGRASPRPVEARRELDGWIEAEGVLPGERVVLNPPPGLRNNQRVRLLNRGGAR